MTKYPRDEPLSILALLIFSLFLLMVGIKVPFFAASVIGGMLLGIFAMFMPNARQQLIFLGFSMPLSVMLVAQGNHAITYLQPHTVDASLSRLGDGLSVAIYHWTLRHRLVHSILWGVYYGLPIFVAFVFGLADRRMACFRSFVLAAIIAPIFYYLVPAVGPAHIGQRGVPRNCFPSLHLTWALELVLYSRSDLRRAAIVYLLLTAAATLGMGEHYAVDLVAAIPYTFALYWIENRFAGFLKIRARTQRSSSTQVSPIPVESETATIENQEEVIT